MDTDDREYRSQAWTIRSDAERLLAELDEADKLDPEATLDVAGDVIAARKTLVLVERRAQELGCQNFPEHGVHGAYRVRGQSSRTKWQKDQLLSHATARIVETPGVLTDEEGELHPPSVIAARVVEQLKGTVSIGGGLIGGMTKLGLDPDEFCTTTWTKKLERVETPEVSE